ncbi:hypothetical protein RJ640_026537 [Escallonia rubra]|uniref:non-specific serine/threonine protein kinase n=1 Tax=Escallonia rubra TaxID=112253 RepID=A0AA88RDP7_9ASTE|nr:hypothetical protein RJ640_026537 [Escallonia rubra]
MANASGLQFLSVDSNDFAGPIPTNLGNLRDLETLGLNGNRFGSNKPDELSFIGSLTNCSNLQELILSKNQFGGVLPGSITNLSSKLETLWLGANKISGSIPQEIGNLNNLYLLKIGHNMISGSIPESIGKLSKLQELRIVRNNISGKIPSSIGNITRLSYLAAAENMLEGNIPAELGNCTNLQALDFGINRLTGVIPEHVIGSSSLSVALYLELNEFTGPLPSSVGNLKNLEKLSISGNKLTGEIPSALGLLHATNKFSPSNLIGEGRYGYVYKGSLNSGEHIVAVKILKLQERGANKSFVAECDMLRILRHRNLIKIITVCSSLDFKGKDFKALVFEFMPNGSLDSWLHPTQAEEQGLNLNLVQRLGIAIDVASALDYIHHHYETIICHCDLKPSNVLLDGGLCAHVEYGMGEEVSTEADMYSYGIMLLEMFTGKRPTESML